jgi:hypothetical protein
MHCLGLTPVQVVEVMVEILQACSSELGVEITKDAAQWMGALKEISPHNYETLLAQ